MSPIEKELEDLKEQIRNLDIHKVYIEGEIHNLQFQLDEINALIDSMSTIFHELKSENDTKEPNLKIIKE